jgi:hypothetical protein
VTPPPRAPPRTHLQLPAASPPWPSSAAPRVWWIPVGRGGCGEKTVVDNDERFAVPVDVAGIITVFLILREKRVGVSLPPSRRRSGKVAVNFNA